MHVPSFICFFLRKKEERPQNLWPYVRIAMLINSFFLLIFWQPILFFRLKNSFFYENRELSFSACSLAEMSSSYGSTSFFNDKSVAYHYTKKSKKVNISKSFHKKIYKNLILQASINNFLFQLLFTNL